MNTRKKQYALLAASLCGAGALGCTAEITGASQQQPGPASPSGGTGAIGGSPAIANGGGGNAAVNSACESDPDLRLPPLLRALNGPQYKNVLRGAFPAARGAVDAMANPWEISEVSTRFSTDGTSLKMNQAATATLLEGARAIASAAQSGIAGAHPCLASLPAGSERTGCLAEVVDDLLGKLYNGQVVDSERVAKIEFFSKLVDDFGTALALETFTSTVMASPRALFRSELGVPAPNGRWELTAREQAEALSFALAGTRPDAELLAAIADGSLSAAELREHAQRLAKAASENGPEAFLSETLTLRQLAETTRTDEGDTNALPEDVRAALELEARETVKRLIRSGGSWIDGLLTSDTAVARKETLKLHGVGEASVTPDAAGFYTLSVGKQRPGLLLQPSMMALLAAENHPDAVKRGHFVLSELMCVPIPPPPQGVAPLPSVDPGKPLTGRQRLQTTHRQPACQGCHTLMDGIGLSFEGFDHLGRERTMELGMPVDTTGEVGVGIASLDGKLQNAQELMQRLSQAREVETCVTTQGFVYLSGVYADTSHEGCLWQATDAILGDQRGNLVDGFASLLASDIYRVRHEAP